MFNCQCIRFFRILLIAIGSIMILGCAPKFNLSQIMAKNILQFEVTGYANGATMPAKYATVAASGQNISIGLTWQKVPAAKSYALLFDDKHPMAHNWVHWLVVDIPATVSEIPEGASLNDMPQNSRELITSWGKPGYNGPQPPVGSGAHEYVARLYALDIEKLNVPERVSRSAFLDAVSGHTIAEATYSGFFERK